MLCNLQAKKELLQTGFKEAGVVALGVSMSNLLNAEASICKIVVAQVLKENELEEPEWRILERQ